MEKNCSVPTNGAKLFYVDPRDEIRLEVRDNLTTRSHVRSPIKNNTLALRGDRMADFRSSDV